MSEDAQSMQTNKINGANSMAMYFGRPLPWPLVHPGDPKQSPNHEAEAGVVGYAAGERTAPWGRAATLATFDRFKAIGFQRRGNAVELLTRSHGPIWDRYLALGLWAARKREDAEIEAAFLEMWGWYVYLSDLVRVPSGPLAGRRVTVNGRYAPWSGTSDCVQQLIKGEKILEPQIIKNGAKYQDNFAALVVQWLVKDGAFANLKPTAPPMPCDFVVTRFAGGHVTSVPPGSLGAGDPWTVTVDYASGKITTNDAGPNLGEMVSRTPLRKVNAA